MNKRPTVITTILQPINLYRTEEIVSFSPLRFLEVMRWGGGGRGAGGGGGVCARVWVWGRGHVEDQVSRQRYDLIFHSRRGTTGCEANNMQ